ncbi:MAG: M24 family metallopeptidase [Acidimicrobiia bacterium]
METLPPMDVAGRLDRLRAQLDAAGVPALLVTRLPNIRYLTGFTGSAGMLLVGHELAVFTTDGRYRDQSHDQLAAVGVSANIAVEPTITRQLEVLADHAQECGWSSIGLEAHGVTWAQQRAWSDVFAGRELVACGPIVENLRMVKDAGEVARIRAACAIADDALGSLLETLHQRPTEWAFARALERAMVDRGASGNSFEPIVASGPNAAKPHARPSERVIEAGELVVIDFGCIMDGYCSDMTRTVSAGEPDPEARRMWETVREAQQLGRDAVAAGVSCADVDRACRDHIAAAGWGDAFVHSTGHGVGLEIHEDPRVAATATATLGAGFVVTVEPGVYVSGVGGVRIEDTVVVTDTGSDPLTAFPKTLVV